MLKKIIFPLSIIVLCLAGLLFSFILAEEFHYLNVPQFKDSTPGIFYKISSQVCGDEGTYFSCANVSKSEYANIKGVPVAVLGLWFYVVILLTALGFTFAPRRTVRPAAGVFLFWSVAIGLACDVALLVISIVYIKAICPFCLATYVTNFVLFGLMLGYLIKKRLNPFRLIAVFKWNGAPVRKAAVVAFYVAALVTVFVGAGIAYKIDSFLIASKLRYIQENKDKEIAAIVAQFAQQEAQNIQPTLLHVYGPPEAPVTIIEFSDFLCPFCAYISTMMDELVQENAGKIQVFFVNYPLDNTCNRYMRRQMHKGACALARGAICAAAQDALAPYQKAAFQARKNGVSRESLSAIMFQSGVTPNEFYQCVNAPETLDTLKEQIEQAQSYDIHATPTLFINKKRFKGRLYKEAIQKIIDLEYEKATADKE